MHVRANCSSVAADAFFGLWKEQVLRIVEQRKSETGRVVHCDDVTELLCSPAMSKMIIKCFRLFVCCSFVLSMTIGAAWERKHSV